MIRAIDLFCGAGGSSCGAREAGAQIVAGFDMWDLALRTFQDNFPEARIYRGNLRRISARKVASELGRIDMIIASPECRGHTPARGNRRPSVNSIMTAFEVTRFARVFKPRWVIVENVPHMRFWDLYPEFVARLKLLGYKVREQLLDAKEFGVPQSRKRLFIMCDLEQLPSAVVGRHNAFRCAISVVNMDGGYPFRPLVAFGRARATLERAKRAIRKLGRGTPFLIVYYSTDGAGGWQRLDVPLRTVTTVDRFALVKWDRSRPIMRMLQPDEIQVAMGFSPSYVLRHGTRRERMHLLGNAVCPPVMEAVVRALTGSHSWG